MSTSDFDRDDDLRALLRSGDPAGSLPAADPAALASLLEDIMSADLDVRPDVAEPVPARKRTPVTWLVAAAAAVVIAGAGAFAVSGLGGEDPAPPSAGRGTTPAPPADPEPAPSADAEVPTEPAPEPIAGKTTRLSVAAQAGKCAVPTAALLAEYPKAFQGQVAAVDQDGGTVTITTTEVFTGEVGETVEVSAAPQLIGAMIGSVKFEVGGTYNVAAYDGQVALCGFSGPAAGRTEALYREAFLS